jgi:hypothetical protein
MGIGIELYRTSIPEIILSRAAGSADPSVVRGGSCEPIHGLWNSDISVEIDCWNLIHLFPRKCRIRRAVSLATPVNKWKVAVQQATRKGAWAS